MQPSASGFWLLNEYPVHRKQPSLIITEKRSLSTTAVSWETIYITWRSCLSDKKCTKSAVLLFTLSFVSALSECHLFLCSSFGAFLEVCVELFFYKFERLMSAARFCRSTETVAHELVVYNHPGTTERPLSEAWLEAVQLIVERSALAKHQAQEPTALPSSLFKWNSL